MGSEHAQEADRTGNTDQQSETNVPGNPLDEKPPAEEDILATQLNIALGGLRRPFDNLFLSGTAAGLDIGFGPLAMAILYSIAATSWTQPTLELGLGFFYSIGFVFVVLGRTELFTEHTAQAVFPVLAGKAELSTLLRFWLIVYAGNWIGSSIFTVTMVIMAPAAGIADPSAFTHIAKPLVTNLPTVTFLAAVMAGWLMGLMSWLVTAVRNDITRLVIIILITGLIGFAHLPHSVAGNVEVLAGVLVSPAISATDYIWFLGLALAGNAVGGTFFIALLRYSYITSGFRN